MQFPHLNGMRCREQTDYGFSQRKRIRRREMRVGIVPPTECHTMKGKVPEIKMGIVEQKKTVFS